MALFRGIQEYIALDANNITLVFDSGNIVNISGNIFLYPPQGHPILYNYSTIDLKLVSGNVLTVGHYPDCNSGPPCLSVDDYRNKEHLGPSTGIRQLCRLWAN